MPDQTTPNQTTNLHVERLARVYDHAGRVIAGIELGHLDLPTPCTDWTVGQLLDHTIGVMHGIAAGVRTDAAAAGDSPGTAGDDPSAAFDAAKSVSLGSWGAPGVFDGTVNFGAGDMPAEVGIGINMLDTLTHTWDLAEATGQDRSMDAELAEAVLAAAQATVTDEIRPGRFAPAVVIDDDAPAHDRLAAFLGRAPS